MIVNFLKSNKNYILLLMFLIFIFLIRNVRKSDDNFENVSTENSSLENIQEEESNFESNDLNEVVVDIKGAVKNPGVYEMKEGDRVNDLIQKAGGMVESNINCVNLSHRLKDEEVIVIPDKDTMCETAENLTQDSSETSNLININTATAEDLQTLNGIGETRAQDIIDYREQNGNFINKEDLKNVSGIGDTTYNNLENSIKV